MDTGKLTQLLKQKHHCLAQLRELGQRQLELIDGGDFGQLLKVLSAKGRLLANLQEVERVLDPFREQAPEERQWADGAQRAACATLLAKCDALLAEIVAQERSSETLLVDRRDAAAKQLNGAHLACEARGAYAAEANESLGQLDLSTDT